MAQPKPTPKFSVKKDVEKPKPRNEAEYLSRSAESISLGKLKTGRKPGPVPVKNITVSLPIHIIEALDELAADRTGNNRSFALLGVIEGRFKL